MSFGEQLIEEVKKHECIYNLKHPDYKQIHKKDAVWEEISKKIGKDAELCKRRWKSIRDSFKKIKILKTLRSRSKSNALTSTKKKKKEKPNWQYYDLLQFLDDFEWYRKGFSSDFLEDEQNAKPPNASAFLEVSISPKDETLTYAEELPTQMCPSSASGANNGKKKRTDLTNFYEGASDAIAKLSSYSASSKTSPLVNHFISLAERIEQSQISEKSKLIIEQEVSQWVLQKIIEEIPE